MCSPSGMPVTYLAIGSSSRSFPSWASCRITAAVIVLVFDAIRKWVSPRGGDRRAQPRRAVADRELDPAACAEEPPHPERGARWPPCRPGSAAHPGRSVAGPTCRPCDPASCRCRASRSATRTWSRSRTPRRRGPRHPGRSRSTVARVATTATTLSIARPRAAGVEDARADSGAEAALRTGRFCRAGDPPAGGRQRRAARAACAARSPSSWTAATPRHDARGRRAAASSRADQRTRTSTSTGRARSSRPQRAANA